MSLLEIIWNWVLFMVAVLMTAAMLSLGMGFVDGEKLRAAEEKKKAWASKVYQRNMERCEKYPSRSWCRTTKS